MIKILVVDDEEEIQRYYRNELAGKVEIIHAFSIEGAERQFAANLDIAAIILDGNITRKMDGLDDTLILLKKFRATFTGPIIAASGGEYFRSQLMENGCSHESVKGLVPERLIEILNL